MPIDWPVLVIALIPVAVWILATIFRGVEEVQRENRPQARDRDEFRVPRRPAGELDRFLREARTRRESPAPEAESEREPVAKPILVPLPVPPRREEAKPRPLPPPPVVPLSGPMPAPSPTPVVRPRPSASPVVGRLYAMLRDRDTQALALVLREVFDKPVSQRQRPPH